MKRFLSIILLAAALFAVSGCANAEPAETTAVTVELKLDAAGAVERIYEKIGLEDKESGVGYRFELYDDTVAIAGKLCFHGVWYTVTYTNGGDERKAKKTEFFLSPDGMEFYTGSYNYATKLATLDTKQIFD